MCYPIRYLVLEQTKNQNGTENKKMCKLSESDRIPLIDYNMSRFRFCFRLKSSSLMLLICLHHQCIVGYYHIAYKLFTKYLPKLYSLKRKFMKIKIRVIRNLFTKNKLFVVMNVLLFLTSKFLVIWY